MNKYKYKLLQPRFLNQYGRYLLTSALLLLYLFSASFYSQAASYQDIHVLEQEAKAWIRTQLDDTAATEISLRTPDANLRLASCPAPLVFDVHGQGGLRGRSNIRVTCSEANWFIFITAEIQHRVFVVVARQDIPRGAPLAAAQLRLEERDLASLRGDYFTDLQALENMETRSRIRAGSLLTSRQVKLRQAVNPGDQVVILAQGERLRIRMLGEALEGGGPGEQIRVRNLQSGRVLRAQVTGPGRVQVLL